MKGVAKAQYNRTQRYGVTRQQWDEMLTRSGGRCDICGAPFRGRTEPQIDHDHVLDAVRGLLCVLCNRTMERIDNVPGWCEKAHAYLRRFHAD